MRAAIRSSVCVVGVATVLASVAVSAQSTGISPAHTGLLGGRTFVSADLACADQSGAAVIPTTLRISAGQVAEHRSVFGTGDLVVLNGGTPAGYAIDQRYFVRRVQAGRTSAGLLSAAPPSVRTSGWLTVTAVDERFALAHIDHACDVVTTGDYLEPFVEPMLPTAAGDGAPRFGESALVLTGADRREVFGAGDVLSILIAAGTTLTPGAHVAFYRDRGVSGLSRENAPTGAPLVEIGHGVVLTVTGDHAQVAVRISRDAVRRGDFAVPKG